MVKESDPDVWHPDKTFEFGKMFKAWPELEIKEEG